MRALLSDAALVKDARSTRSRQRKLGPSSIGTCRRRAGYEHHGVKPSNPENLAGIPAVWGTWIHDGALKAMQSEWGAIIETVVEDDVLRGHADALHLPADLLERLPAKYHHPNPIAELPTVEDLKTKRDARMVDYVRSTGPKRAELYQVHLYGDLVRSGKIKPLKSQAALAELGPIDVQRVNLRYVARDGSGEEYLYEQDYDPEITVEARGWVQQVLDASGPDDLPRDQDGPGLSTICDNCPFKLACWGPEVEGTTPQSRLVVDDADRTDALAVYHEGLVLSRQADALKKKARAMLDGSDRAIYTDGKRAFKLGWSGGRPLDPKPDLDAMLALYERANLEVPMLPSRPSSPSISVTPYEVPDSTCGEDVDGEPCALKAKHSGGCAVLRVAETTP